MLQNSGNARGHGHFRVMQRLNWNGITMGPLNHLRRLTILKIKC